MEDVNNQEPAASAGEVSTPEQSSAETLNTAKVSESVPYERFQEVNTEKTTLAEQNRQLQAQLDQLNQQNQQSQYRPQQNYGYQNQQVPQQGYNQSQQDYTNKLVEQFGYEGAAAIFAMQNQQNQLSQQTAYTLAYQNKSLEMRMKFGQDFDKFNYRDPYTGSNGNQVVDLIAKGLTEQQAWNALNAPDVNKLKQEALNEAHLKVQGKLQATPKATGSGIGGQGTAATGTRKPKTIEEAWEMAEQSLS